MIPGEHFGAPALLLLLLLLLFLHIFFRVVGNAPCSDFMFFMFLFLF